MGTDYRFKITKKDSNGKAGDVIAEFWYNRIKNVSNPQQIPNSSFPDAVKGVVV